MPLAFMFQNRQNDIMQHRQFWHYAVYTSLLLLLIRHTQVMATPYPSPNPDSNLTDLSGYLAPEYLGQMSSRLDSYPFEVRALFLPETRRLQLATYAEQIFREWHMPAESLLLIVALDRRKIGVHIGPELREKLGNQTQQEFNLPGPSSAPSGDKQQSEASHLDLLPSIIDDVSESLKKQTPPPTKKASPPHGQPQASNPPLFVGNTTPGLQGAPRKTDSLSVSALPVWIFLALTLLTGGLILAVKRWQQQRAHQQMIGKYALEGQTSYNELETLYARIDQLIPAFHAYQGETQSTLRLYLKELQNIQTRYDELFDRYEEESNLLNHSTHTLETIDFFHELEKALAKGEELFAQGQQILKNIENIKKNNQVQFSELALDKQRVSQDLQALRKINPALKLSKLLPHLQKYTDQLQHMENLNREDPLRIEKNMKQWQKSFLKTEREIQALPHLWQQLKQELSVRLDELKQRSESRQDLHRRQEEVTQLYNQILQAIEEGDLGRISDLNEKFTKQLQLLESEV